MWERNPPLKGGKMNATSTIKMDIPMWVHPTLKGGRLMHTTAWYIQGPLRY